MKNLKNQLSVKKTVISSSLTLMLVVGSISSADAKLFGTSSSTNSSTCESMGYQTHTNYIHIFGIKIRNGQTTSAC